MSRKARFRGKIHNLKTWPDYYHQVVAGYKKCEVRRNDRNFRVGDVLNLREWDQQREQYTGRNVFRLVTHIVMGGEFGISKDYCVLSLEKMEKPS